MQHRRRTRHRSPSTTSSWLAKLQKNFLAWSNSWENIRKRRCYSSRRALASSTSRYCWQGSWSRSGRCLPFTARKRNATAFSKILENRKMVFIFGCFYRDDSLYFDFRYITEVELLWYNDIYPYWNIFSQVFLLAPTLWPEVSTFPTFGGFSSSTPRPMLKPSFIDVAELPGFHFLQENLDVSSKQLQLKCLSKIIRVGAVDNLLLVPSGEISYPI